MAKNAKQLRQSRTDINWDMVEAPRTDLPDPGRLQWRRRALKTLVWAVLISWPILAIAFANNLVQSSDRPVVASASQSQFNVSRAVATDELRMWLAHRPSPLPDAVILSADNVDRVVAPVPGTDQGTDPVPGVDVAHFTVSSRGTLYRVAVQVQTTADGGATVIDTPSLEPVYLPPDTSGNTAVAWPGLTSVDPSDTMTKAVASWAQAYTSGDPGTLRQALGDPAMTDYFTPLSGVATVVPTVSQAASLDAQGTKVVARVTLQITWTGQRIASGDTVPSVSYDVLIERADTAAPLVTAWGAPGTGQSLVRYGNAIHTADQPDPSSTATGPIVHTPTPTPTHSKPSAPATHAKPAPHASATHAKPAPKHSASTHAKPSGKKK